MIVFRLWKYIRECPYTEWAQSVVLFEIFLFPFSFLQNLHMRLSFLLGSLLDHPVLPEVKCLSYCGWKGLCLFLKSHQISDWKNIVTRSEPVTHANPEAPLTPSSPPTQLYILTNWSSVLCLNTTSGQEFTTSWCSQFPLWTAQIVAIKSLLTLSWNVFLLCSAAMILVLPGTDSEHESTLLPAQVPVGQLNTEASLLPLPESSLFWDEHAHFLSLTCNSSELLSCICGLKVWGAQGSPFL